MLPAIYCPNEYQVQQFYSISKQLEDLNQHVITYTSKKTIFEDEEVRTLDELCVLHIFHGVFEKSPLFLLNYGSISFGKISKKCRKVYCYFGDY